MIDDWEKHMNEFVADEMLSFEVGPEKEEVIIISTNKPGVL